jgi:hypothetical protein
MVGHEEFDDTITADLLRAADEEVEDENPNNFIDPRKPEISPRTPRVVIGAAAANSATRSSAPSSTMTMGRSVHYHSDGESQNWGPLDKDDSPHEEATNPRAVTRGGTNKVNKSKRVHLTTVASSSDEEDEQEQGQPKRQLRARTFTQAQPYTADKVRYSKSKTNGGRVLDESEVEKELISTQKKVNQATKAKKEKGGVESSMPAAREKRLSSTDTIQSTSANTDNSSTSTTSLPDDIRVMRDTVLNVRIKGEDNRVPVSLQQCPDLQSLFQHVNSTLGKHYNQTARQIVCMLPWKEEMR